MWKRELVKVEDIRIENEPVNPDTWVKVYPHDGSGEYSPDGRNRCIVWIDADDNDEYPRQRHEWYAVGTMIPLEVWSDK
jgi:hypothetical protein